jgi:hypothetical protein
MAADERESDEPEFQNFRRNGQLCFWAPLNIYSSFFVSSSVLDLFFLSIWGAFFSAQQHKRAIPRIRLNNRFDELHLEFDTPETNTQVRSCDSIPIQRSEPSQLHPFKSSSPLSL